MTALNRLIDEMNEQNRMERQQQHTQTVSLSNDAHAKLVRLSEQLRVSKTSLASKLLTAAIEDAGVAVFRRDPEQVQRNLEAAEARKAGNPEATQQAREYIEARGGTATD